MLRNKEGFADDGLGRFAVGVAHLAAGAEDVVRLLPVCVCVRVRVFSAAFRVSPILFTIVMNILSALFSLKHNQPGHTGLPF